MNNENGTGGSPPKGKRGLLTGLLIGLVVLLALALVFLATPLKDMVMARNSAPVISLELVGEPAEEGGEYLFEIEAVVAGKPSPQVTFDRDDSMGEAGENRAWVLLSPGEKYTVTARAENSVGSASASLELAAPGESGDTSKPSHGTTPSGSDKPEEKGPGSEGKPLPGESGENNPPVIKSIEVGTSPVFTGVKYKVTAEASDPDGDPLSYEWSGDGSISGANANPMTWTAPAEKGDYTVKVTVKDGRGGTAAMNKTITVNDPISPPKLKKKITLVPVEGGESGWIIENGSLTTTATYAGDNKNNQMVRGCVSLDIGELAGREVVLVKLHMKNPQVFGDPSAMGNLVMGTARWGARKLVAADYNLAGTGIGWPATYDVTLTSIPGSGSANEKALAEALQKCIDDGLNRFQFRFQFSKNKTNDNNSPDGVQYEFKDISLYVEYY